MKILLPIFFFSILILSSCQSEYDIQLLHVRELVEQEANYKCAILSNDQLDENMIELLRTIRNEIELRAHLSGNERLFLQEVQTYRELAAAHLNQPAILITKFP
jgi:hypothetical protein